MPVVSLSNIQVDYEQLRAQLIAELEKNPAWTDLVPAGVGTALTEFFAAIGAYEQYGIERALQETMLDTARQDKSIFVIARMLGVHIQRKQPASVKVRLTLDSSEVFSGLAYTRFLINGRQFFNRDPFYIDPAQSNSTDITLFEGEIVREEMLAEGGSFQRYTLGNSDNTISDLDLFCTINGLDSYSKSILGLWKFKENEASFYENTLPDGNVEILFGNSIYGKVPPQNSSILFTYVRTNGAGGNRAQSGEELTAPDYPLIKGVTISSITGGQDEKDAEFYRIFAPHLYSSKERMVTRDDYRAVSATYAGVVDAAFLGQAEIAPYDVRWMNMIQYTLLTDPPFSGIQHEEFVKWVNQKGIFQTRLIRRDPVKTELDVSLEVYCKERSNLADVKGKVEQAIKRFFAPRAGSLGYSIYLSDIYNAAKRASQDIEFVYILTPTENTIIDRLDYCALRELRISMDYTSRMTPREVNNAV